MFFGSSIEGWTSVEGELVGMIPGPDAARKLTSLGQRSACNHRDPASRLKARIGTSLFNIDSIRATRTNKW
jgi:hypothetical protein